MLTSENKLSEALTSYKQLISLIESIKGKLSPQEQKSLSENYGFIYDELVSVLYSMSTQGATTRAHFASEALRYAEKNKARQFAESWGRVFKIQMGLALSPSIREREVALYSQRDRVLARLDGASATSEKTGTVDTKNLEAELKGIDGQIREFLQGLRQASPQYAAVAYPEDVQLSALPLRPGESLVEFKVTEDSTFVWIIQNRNGTQNQLAAFYRVPQKRSWLIERFNSVRRVLNSANPDLVDWKVCEALFAALFPDEAATTLLESQEIIFVPDDVLFVLPLEVLSPRATKGDFPLLRKATAYYPSSDSLRLARTAGHPSHWREAFLGIADPITSPNDERFQLVEALKSPTPRKLDQTPALKDQQQDVKPDSNRLKSRGFSFERLPSTAAEVQAIASLLKERKEEVELRIGINATKSELLDTDLSRFRFLHFATHGVLPVDTGIQEPSLVLSSDGVDFSHMFLSMSEILGLKLEAESVVLSACNTGSGEISRAEGVMSLGRAFLAAGASSVTVSLWKVSDESTALLMESYYKRILEGMKKSVALAEARYTVFKSGSTNPFFWAPFIVIGE